MATERLETLPGKPVDIVTGRNYTIEVIDKERLLELYRDLRNAFDFLRGSSVQAADRTRLLLEIASRAGVLARQMKKCGAPEFPTPIKTLQGMARFCLTMISIQKQFAAAHKGGKVGHALVGQLMTSVTTREDGHDYSYGNAWSLCQAHQATVERFSGGGHDETLPEPAAFPVHSLLGDEEITLMALYLHDDAVSKAVMEYCQYAQLIEGRTHNARDTLSLLGAHEGNLFRDDLQTLIEQLPTIPAAERRALKEEFIEETLDLAEGLHGLGQLRESTRIYLEALSWEPHVEAIRAGGWRTPNAHVRAINQIPPIDDRQSLRGRLWQRVVRPLLGGKGGGNFLAWRLKTRRNMMSEREREREDLRRGGRLNLGLHPPEMERAAQDKANLRFIETYKRWYGEQEGWTRAMNMFEGFEAQPPEAACLLELYKQEELAKLSGHPTVKLHAFQNLQPAIEDLVARLRQVSADLARDYPLLGRDKRTPQFDEQAVYALMHTFVPLYTGPDTVPAGSGCERADWLLPWLIENFLPYVKQAMRQVRRGVEAIENLQLLDHARRANPILRRIFLGKAVEELPAYNRETLRTAVGEAVAGYRDLIKEHIANEREDYDKLKTVMRENSGGIHQRDRSQFVDYVAGRLARDPFALLSYFYQNPTKTGFYGLLQEKIAEDAQRAREWDAFWQAFDTVATIASLVLLPVTMGSSLAIGLGVRSLTLIRILRIATMVDLGVLGVARYSAMTLHNLQNYYRYAEARKDMELYFLSTGQGSEQQVMDLIASSEVEWTRCMINGISSISSVAFCFMGLRDLAKLKTLQGYLKNANGTLAGTAAREAARKQVLDVMKGVVGGHMQRDSLRFAARKHVMLGRLVNGTIDLRNTLLKRMPRQLAQQFDELMKSMGAQLGNLSGRQLRKRVTAALLERLAKTTELRYMVGKVARLVGWNKLALSLAAGGYKFLKMDLDPKEVEALSEQVEALALEMMFPSQTLPADEAWKLDTVEAELKALFGEGVERVESRSADGALVQCDFRIPTARLLDGEPGPAAIVWQFTLLAKD